MATESDIILDLITSFAWRQDKRFMETTRQAITLSTAKNRNVVARKLEGLLEQIENQLGPQMFQLSGNMGKYIHVEQPTLKLADITLSPFLRERIDRILLEWNKRELLAEHGLWFRRKILLGGPPGTGKTMSARVLAGETGLPLFHIKGDQLVDSLLGKTAQNLREIFDEIGKREGVFLLDEFDGIGAKRGDRNEVGEMNRIVCAVLQFLEQDVGAVSFVIMTTNMAHKLDIAFFRRFDEVLTYTNPNADERESVVKYVLKPMEKLGKASVDYFALRAASEGMSHAEVTLACIDAMKTMLLENHLFLSTELVANELETRRHIGDISRKAK